MAAAPTPTPAMPPPPGGRPSGASSAQSSASPAPPQTNPQLESASQVVIKIVQGLRGLSAAFPMTAPAISQILDLMRTVQIKMMQNQAPPEPSAPPVGGG